MSAGAPISVSVSAFVCSASPLYDEKIGESVRCCHEPSRNPRLDDNVAEMLLSELERDAKPLAAYMSQCPKGIDDCQDIDRFKTRHGFFLRQCRIG